MTRHKMLKDLKNVCKTDIEYNNTISYLLEAFKKMYEKGLRRSKMPTCDNEDFLCGLLDEKIKQLRRIRYDTKESYIKQRCLALTKEYLNLKKHVRGKI